MHSLRRGVMVEEPEARERRPVRRNAPARGRRRIQPETPGGRRLVKDGFLVFSESEDGKWFEVMAPGDHGQFEAVALRQGPKVWHLFLKGDDSAATGESPLDAVEGEGEFLDLISDDEAAVKRFEKLVESAPIELSREYAGLERARVEVGYDRQTRREEGAGKKGRGKQPAKKRGGKR